MKKKVLLLHLPVIHRGYLEFLRRASRTIDDVCILGEDILRQVRFYEKDIAALKPEDARELVKALNLFNRVTVVEKGMLEEVADRKVVMINDELSRRFAAKFLPNLNIAWQSVFLRWDESHVVKTFPVDFKRKSESRFDKLTLKAAYDEAKKSGDWWRQVGAVLVKGGRPVLSAYNREIPNEHSSYALGNIRDFVKPGEKPEISNAIHAESGLIAEAARKGIGLDGSSIYVTHFPCPMCAKAIAIAGIKKCFFGEGSANFDAEAVLKSSGVEIIFVPLKN